MEITTETIILLIVIAIVFIIFTIAIFRSSKDDDTGLDDFGLPVGSQKDKQ